MPYDPIYDDIASVSEEFSYDTVHTIDEGILKKALDEMEGAAAKFVQIAEVDSAARFSYVKKIAEMRTEVLKAVKAHEMTLKEGAEYANKMRNIIMEEIRRMTTPYGKSIAMSIKSKGKSLEEILNKKVNDLIKENKLPKGSTFETLSEAQKKRVYYRAIRSSGTADIRVVNAAKKLRIMGRVFIVVTGVLAGYSIITAEDKKKEALRQGAILGGGLVGGALAGLGVGAICGPGAPVCAIAVMLLGGFVGSFAADVTFDEYEEEIDEFLTWDIR